MNNNNRYSRQERFAPIGVEGQKRLGEAQVVIAGVGALGTVLANHMVRAGVGAVRLIDRDYVEWSNLQRQMLFDEADAEQALPKAEAARRKLMRVNSSCKLEACVTDLTPLTVNELLSDADLVLDGTDNFQTRYLLNDACFLAGIPFIYGGAVSSRGMSAPFVPGDTCCMRCVIPEAEADGQTCDMIGVIAPIIDVVASFQAVEGLKLLVGDRQKLRRSLITWELWEYYAYELKLPPPRANCPVCGRGEYPALQAEAGEAAMLCGRETVQISGNKRLDLAHWRKRMEAVAAVSSNPYLLRAVLPEGETLVMFADGRVLVQGTDNIIRAKSLYARYIGL